MEVTKDADEQGPAGSCSLWLGGLGPGRVGPAQDVHFTCGQRGAGDSRGTRTTRGPSRGSGLCSRGDRPSTAGFSCPPPRREGACGAPEGRSGQPQVACPRGGGRARPCRGIPSSRCREAAWGCACRRGRAPSCHRKQGQALLWGAQVRAHHCGMCALDALPARGPDGGGPWELCGHRAPCRSGLCPQATGSHRQGCTWQAVTHSAGPPLPAE